MSGKTFVIPDIHGEIDILNAALARIEARQSGGTVVFTGDYVDRGPDSAAVVARLMAGPKNPGWTWVCLKGNHEDMMLAALAQEADLGWWVGNGGGQTLVSYGGTVPEDHIQWCKNRPHYYCDKHRVYVHAGVDTTKSMEEQTEAMLLWYRCGKRENYIHPRGYVVHGHTPFEDGPIILSGRANLDTGAVFTGRMCVAVFDDETPGEPTEIMIVRSRA